MGEGSLTKSLSPVAADVAQSMDGPHGSVFHRWLGWGDPGVSTDSTGPGRLGEGSVLLPLSVRTPMLTGKPQGHRRLYLHLFFWCTPEKTSENVSVGLTAPWTFSSHLSVTYFICVRVCLWMFVSVICRRCVQIGRFALCLNCIFLLYNLLGIV